mgnify:FL=1
MRAIFFLLVSLLVLSVNFIFADSWPEKPDYDFYAHPLLEISKSKDNYAVGSVIKIIKTDERSDILSVKITHGVNKGQIVEAVNFKDGFLIDVRPGSRVLLSYKDNINSAGATVVDYDRTLSLMLLAFLFLLFVLIIGGLNKLGGLFTLFAGIVIIIFVYVPLIIRGYSPLIISLFIVFFITSTIIFFIGKFSRKSVSAIVGTLLSIIFVLILGMIFYPLANINGFSLESIQFLNYFSKNYSSWPFNNFQQLLFSVLIIGASGVIIDVAVCVASSMEQIVLKRSDISRKELIHYGMNVGRDISSIVSNTLVLAYFGAELILIISLTVSIRSLTNLFNNEWFFIVVFQAVAGSIGFLLAVPFTAISSGYLMVRK